MLLKDIGETENVDDSCDDTADYQNSNGLEIDSLNSLWFLCSVILLYIGRVHIASHRVLLHLQPL